MRELDELEKKVIEENITRIDEENMKAGYALQMQELFLREGLDIKRMESESLVLQYKKIITSNTKHIVILRDQLVNGVPEKTVIDVKEEIKNGSNE